MDPLASLKAAASGYSARDLNDAAKAKEVVEKVARELVENGTRSMPRLNASQKAELAKFAGDDPVISNKILSFVREQVEECDRIKQNPAGKGGVSNFSTEPRR